MSCYKQGLQIAIGLMFDFFQALAYITAFDIDLSVFLEGQPTVYPINKVFCFIDTKMSY